MPEYSFPFRATHLLLAIIQEGFLCPLYSVLLFRLDHPQLQTLVFFLLSRMHRFLQDRRADAQICHVLVIERVVWLILIDLGTETHRDSIFECALRIYKIPLDDRIRRLELAELGVVRFAKQILCDLRQGLR